MSSHPVPAAPQARSRRLHELTQVGRRVWGPTHELAAGYRRTATALIYGSLAAASLVAAYLLRFDFHIPADQRTALEATVLLAVGLRLIASWVFSISTARWRYVGTRDATRLLASTLAATAALWLLSWQFGVLAPVPRTVLIIDLFIYTSLTAGMWLGYRTLFEQLRFSGSGERRATRVLIVGAGEAGTMLAREIVRSTYRRVAVGFIDDDRAKWGTTIHGLRVHGGLDRIGDVVRSQGVQEIVIAVPSAKPAQLRRFVEACEAMDVAFTVLPGLADVFSGRVNWAQVRPLRIEDLLGRDPIALELPELYGDLHDQVVLITGAAGSIGSELARQVALHQPRTLVILDQSETGLFDIENELRERHPELRIVCVIADIVDEVEVEAAFLRFRPSRVFHAAAYKHVNMMQSNVRQAVRNNVTGTLYVASAAGRHGAEKFVFVSTDKAVAPTSVMGATKRLAEMLLRELEGRFPATAYAAVRFGNVLGSNGSVIPIFRRQIEQRRPLTITHPDVTRYFMMIPEAVQLILQTSVLPEVRGRIAMLEMGEPVRILDLARNLLRLAGLPSRIGDTIVFTGLKRGEKLHEELVGPDELTTPTRIDKVRIVHPESAPTVHVVQLLAEWEMAFRTGQESRVAADLKAMFPGLDLQLEAPAEPLPVDVPLFQARGA